MREPSEETATSTGRTPLNWVLTVTVPSAARMVRTPRTAPLSGPQPGGGKGRPGSTPPELPPPVTSPSTPTKQLWLPASTTGGAASSVATAPASSTASGGGANIGLTIAPPLEEPPKPPKPPQGPPPPPPYPPWIVVESDCVVSAWCTATTEPEGPAMTRQATCGANVLTGDGS